MNKTIVASCVAVVLAGTAVAGQFIAKSKYDDLAQTYRAQVTQESGVSFDIEVLEDDLFKRSEKIVLRFDKELLANLGQYEDFELTIENQARFFPFMVHGTTDIDQQQPALKAVLEQWGLEQIPFTSSWKANGITQTLTTYFDMDAFEFSFEDVSIQVKALQGTSVGSIDMQDMDAEISWQGLSVTGDAGKFAIGDVEVTEQLAFRKGIWNMPMFEMLISSMTFEENALSNFSMEQLKFATLVEEQADEIKIGFNTELQNFEFSDMGSSGKVSNLLISTDIEGINAELYRKLTELGQQAEPDPMVAQQLGLELFGNGLKWLVDKAQAELEFYNGQQQVAGSFSINGGVELDQVDLTTLQVPQQILSFMQGEFQIEATSSMLDELPVSPQIQMFRQQGMIEQVGDKDSVKITLKDGSLAMNGNPLM